MGSYKNEFVEEKRKLLYWLTQSTEDDLLLENNSVDIKEASILFQNLGFRLEKNFEKVADVDNYPSVENNVLKVELTCPKSNLRSVLIKEFITCKCPSEAMVGEGEFWTVSGNAPSKRDSINSSNSSLLPTITPAKSVIIKGLLGRVVAAINELGSNENAEYLNSSLSQFELTRHRSLDTLKSCEGNTARGLKRRPSWEVDPRTSPPTQTSSPVVRLSNSLNQISSGSDTSNMLVKNLEAIKKLVEETVDIAAGENPTYTKITNIITKRVSDIKPTEIASYNSNTNGSTQEKAITSRKRSLSTENGKTGVPSKVSTLNRRIIPTSTLIGASGTHNSLRKCTPSPNFIRKNIDKSGESKATSKPNTLKSSLFGVNRANEPEAGPSGLQRKPQLVRKQMSGSTSALPRRRL